MVAFASPDVSIDGGDITCINSPSPRLESVTPSAAARPTIVARRSAMNPTMARDRLLLILPNTSLSTFLSASSSTFTRPLGTEEDGKGDGNVSSEDAEANDTYGSTPSFSSSSNAANRGGVSTSDANSGKEAE